MSKIISILYLLSKNLKIYIINLNYYFNLFINIIINILKKIRILKNELAIIIINAVIIQNLNNRRL